MAYEFKDLSMGVLAAPTTVWNSSSYQFRAVAASTVEGYFKILGTTHGMVPVGIIQNKPRQYESGEIWMPGCVSKVQAGAGGITVGKNVCFHGDGKAYSTGSLNKYDPIYGPCLLSASSGDIGTISFSLVGIKPTT